MPVTRTPRDEWVQEGLRALADGGAGAVRIEALAKGLGVTKGGFYWHFADRGALLDEMLAAWEQRVIDDVISFVEGQGGDARARLRRLFAVASEGGGDLIRTELAIRDWARRDKQVERRLGRVDDRRMAYMRSLFAGICADEAEAEARCLLVFSLFVASPFIAAEHPSRSRREVVELALERLLF